MLMLQLLGFSSVLARAVHALGAASAGGHERSRPLSALLPCVGMTEGPLPRILRVSDGAPWVSGQQAPTPLAALCRCR